MLIDIAILVALIILAIILIGYFVGIYNGLVARKNNIDRSFSNIDVLLKQRHDELPKLIDTCKGYMKYEQETLQKVVEARNAYGRAATPDDKAEADNLTTGALKTLFAISEKYPDLKADANFMQLQERISDLEAKIAGQRSAYNEDVNYYNIRIAQVPANLVAGLMGLRPHTLFQVAEADRQDVKVSFA
jgi:LemA protein